jgi:hypothetical protein
VAIPNASPFTFRPRGLTDDVDGSSAFPGAMSVLQNIVPSPTAAGQWVCRTASVQLSNFSGFTTPGAGSALLIIGNLAWGMIGSARNAGKDEPFCYNLVTAAFVTIGNVTAANVPATQSSSGDWTPPTLHAPTNGRIIITHPGYNGTTQFIGWIDVSSFSSTGITGDTHTSTLIDALSSNPVTAGWQVGMRVTGAGIAVNTFIVSMTSTSITLSQATTATAAGVALTVAGGTPAAPLYGAGNVNGNPFTSVPACAAAFNGRSYYGVGNYTIYSDVLNPTQVSAASQALQIGDSTPVTALGGVPMTTPVSGGVAQSLIVFKGAGPYTQILGDAATLDLTKNEVAGSVGTLSPLSICPTPIGLAYISTDGLRFVTQDGMCSPVVGDNGEGVAAPFMNVVNPSRTCACYGEHTIRISVKNALSAGQVFEEYWFETKARVWSGPHSFPASIMRPYYGASISPFVFFASGVDAKLWNGATEPTTSSTYTENGTALSFVWQTTLLPDNEAMAMNSVVESTLAYQTPANQMMTAIVLDDAGEVLDTVYLNGPQLVSSQWGSFNWGEGVWGDGVIPYRQYQMPWNQPLVFKQALLRVSGLGLQNFVLGELRLRYQILGYTLP